MELTGANGMTALKDAPALSTGNAHSVTDSVSYLHMMMDSSADLEYIESVYSASSDSTRWRRNAIPMGTITRNPSTLSYKGDARMRRQTRMKSLL